MTAVIDTCVIVDVLQNREPFSEDALKIFLAVSNRQFRGVLTAKSITDIFYILRRSLHNEAETRNCLNKLFILFDVEDTFAADCKYALSSETKDYEDAVMIETAKRIGANCIVTRNQKDCAVCKLPVYSPAEFLEILNNDE